MKLFQVIIVLILFTTQNFSQFGFAWQNPMPQGKTLNSIFPLTDQLIYAAGSRGSFIKSVDGGSTWQIKS
ncbi:MAG: hypothetical protein Q8Q47_05365, partial [Ignavibacteriaceae bacterium]|nr:hypothetical protein [Ignavibacteriaceae bacterium]